MTEIPSLIRRLQIRMFCEVPGSPDTWSASLLCGGLAGSGLAVAVFGVDDVPTVRTRLPTRRLAELAGKVLAVSGDPDLPVLEPDRVHPLLSAVGASAVHRPLVLSPGAVWLAIAQGVAPQLIRLMPMSCGRSW